MPREFAPADSTPVPGSRPTAQSRPSDQSPASRTSWPRSRSPARVAAGSRSSATSVPGSAPRGWNEAGKLSLCQAGASMASCRDAPIPRWRSRNSSCHWSCWSPPGVPQASTGTPSRDTRVGDRVLRGRRPGTREDASPGSSQVICSRLPRQNPSSGIVGEDCSQPPLGVAEIIVPAASTTSTCTVSPG